MTLYSIKTCGFGLTDCLRQRQIIPQKSEIGGKTHKNSGI
jgi:hypothetical protein